MFTGIVKGLGTVREVEHRPGLTILIIDLPESLLTDLALGASIAVDGVCLTVTKFTGSQVHFDVMQETLNLTTLGTFKPGQEVNVERSLKEGDEIGGHPISGHVDGYATISAIEQPENNYIVTFAAPANLMKYIFQKGFLAVNGTSLTVASVNREAGTFTIWLIPETLRLTTFGAKQVGDRVNLEIERSTQVMVDTVRSFLEERLGKHLPNLSKLLDC